ncbi:MAG: OmpA family protein [Saprospiraceae bacterium]|nr:OmpA family protein [Saprospiraceae bacterium]
MKWYLFLFCLLSFSLQLRAQEGGDGQPFKIVSIFFRGGSYYVDEEQKDVVREFMSKQILMNYEIHIHSHTDNVGGVEFNEWLSRMRSEATYQFLKEDGIPTNQLFIKDHGLFNPDYDNDSSMGRAKNRRVDIVLWPLPS